MTTLELELEALDSSIAQMGGAAEEQLGRAIEALRGRDTELAREVIAGDARIDTMEDRLDRDTAMIFSRHTLMATNLRRVLATIKVCSTIERIGDLAKSSARRSIILSENPPLRSVAAVVRLGQQTQIQCAEALDAFAHRDEKLSRAVWAKDEELDNLYNGLQREIVEAMSSSPSEALQCTQLLFLAKNMERIGDHATFIAEMTLYILTGEKIGDQRPKGAPDGSHEALKALG